MCHIPLDFIFQQHCCKNLKPYVVICTKLRIHAFWDVMLCHGARGSWHFKGSRQLLSSRIKQSSSCILLSNWRWSCNSPLKHKHSLSDTVSHAKILAFSAAQLGQPQISHSMRLYKNTSQKTLIFRHCHNNLKPHNIFFFWILCCVVLYKKNLSYHTVFWHFTLRQKLVRTKINADISVARSSFF